MQSLRPDNHFAVVLDVTDSDSINQCFDKVVEKYKRPPDVIVNCAGILDTKCLLDASEEEFYKIMDVNVKGTFLVTKVTIQDLR